MLWNGIAHWKVYRSLPVDDSVPNPHLAYIVIQSMLITLPHLRCTLLTCGFCTKWIANGRQAGMRRARRAREAWLMMRLQAGDGAGELVRRSAALIG